MALDFLALNGSLRGLESPLRHPARRRRPVRLGAPTRSASSASPEGRTRGAA